MSNFRGPIASLVGGAVDLTNKYKADRKERKAKETPTATDASSSGASNDTPPPAEQYDEHESSRDSSIDEQWALDLDEAQQECNATSSAADNTDFDGILERLAAQPVPPSRGNPNRLELPVILPQRRPGAQHRGFVHAYAPLLGECDVDEKAWMEFLEGLDASINANPWFNVVNAATGVVGMASSAVSGFSLVGLLGGFAVSLVLEKGRKGYVQYRQNGYLDQANESFFKPRGLYCFFVAYKPDAAAEGAVAEVDLQTNTARAIEQRGGQGKWKKLTAAAATSQREAEIPASAPLVFPQLDALDESQKANAFKRWGNSLAGYFDKRAVDKFDGQNPHSKLTAGQASHAAPPSAYEDQDVPSEGDDSVSPPEKKNPTFQGPVARAYRTHKERRAQRKQNKNARSSKWPLKRLMTEDVLYLMVTNMPTQEELDRLAAAMAQ